MHLILSRDENNAVCITESGEFHEALAVAKTLKGNVKIIPFEVVAHRGGTAYESCPLLEMTGRDYRRIMIPLESDERNGFHFWSSKKEEMAVLNMKWGKKGEAGTEMRKAWVRNLPRVWPNPIEYVYTKKGAVYIIEMERVEDDGPGWFESLKSTLKISARMAPKIIKRLGNVDKPAPLYGAIPRSMVKVFLVTERDGFTKEETEILLDGGLVITQAWVDYALANLEAERMRNPEWCSEGIAEKCKESKIHSARFFFPGKEKNFGKGNAAVVPGDDFKIWLHPTNLKTGLMIEGDIVYFLLDPQPAKAKEVTNTMFVINQPHIFPPRDVAKWFSDELKRKLERLNSGKFAESAMEEYDAFMDAMENGETELSKDGHNSRVRRLLGEWMKMGGMPTEAPQLYLNAIRASTQAMLDQKKINIRARIPFAIHQQVISQALANLIDPEFGEVKEGKIRAWDEYDVHVIGNRTDLATRDNHGGWDKDDFFSLIYRRVGGKVGVFLLRNPNEDGNYDWFELQGPPSRMLPRGEVPGCMVLRKDWPVQKAAMPPIESGLPEGDKFSADREYSYEDFLRDINKPSGNPGGYINAGVLRSLAGLTGTRMQLGFEQAIDVGQQGGSAAQIQFVRDMAVQEEYAVIRSKRPVPKTYWDTKFARRQHPAVTSTTHWFEVLYQHCVKECEAYMAAVAAHVWDNYVLPMEIAHCYEGNWSKHAARWCKEFYGIQEAVKTRLRVKMLTKDGWKQVDKGYQELWDRVKPELREKFIPWIAYQVHLGNEKVKAMDWVLFKNDDIWAEWIAWMKKNRTK